VTSLLTAILFATLVAQSAALPDVDDDVQTAPPAANAPAKVDAPAEPQDEAESHDPAVVALLDKLETAAKDLRDFSASLRYDKWDPVTNRWEIRAGDLLYEVKADDTKRFAMLFETLIVGTRRQDRQRHYVYDNGWLAEIDFEQKQFIKRQIVAPGKEFDPFKLGEGPFPLPIGQNRDDVLNRFNVTLLDQPEDDKLADLENVEGMRLIPKPRTREAENFERVDVFYDKDTHLPVGIAVVERNPSANAKIDLREKKIVRLRDVKRNQGIDPKKLDIAEPDPKEWSINIEPWQGGE